MTPFLTCSHLESFPTIKHAFFTRQLEGSHHNYASPENRTIAMQHLRRQGKDLCILKQEHTANVVTVESNWPITEPRVADAMVTNIPNLALGILTADCTPILYADVEAGVIGAAHAGWKGAKAGIIENTVRAMVKLGARPSCINAAIGPCIQQSSYEVGEEFHENFLQDTVTNAAFFIPSQKLGHFMFDMPGFVTEKLLQAGISTITNLHRDTCAEEEYFFSYRRCCLRGEPYRKSGLSAISIT